MFYPHYCGYYLGVNNENSWFPLQILSFILNHVDVNHFYWCFRHWLTGPSKWVSSTHRNRRGITSNKTSHQTIPQHHPGFLGFFIRVWNLVNPMVGCTTARQVELIVSYININQPLIINTIAGNAEWSLNKYEWF